MKQALVKSSAFDHGRMGWENWGQGVPENSPVI